MEKPEPVFPSTGKENDDPQDSRIFRNEDEPADVGEILLSVVCNLPKPLSPIPSSDEDTEDEDDTLDADEVIEEAESAAEEIEEENLSPKSEKYDDEIWDPENKI